MSSLFVSFRLSSKYGLFTGNFLGHTVESKHLPFPITPLSCCLDSTDQCLKSTETDRPGLALVPRWGSVPVVRTQYSAVSKWVSLVPDGLLLFFVLLWICTFITWLPLQCVLKKRKGEILVLISPYQLWIQHVFYFFKKIFMLTNLHSCFEITFYFIEK